jgi:hypothetical protein
VIVSADSDFSEEVVRLTHGRGVNVVYDGADADTFYGAQASLGYYGVLAYYGQTIKSLPPIDLTDLPKSILVTFPVVHHLVRTYEALTTHSRQLFTWIQRGAYLRSDWSTISVGRRGASPSRSGRATYGWEVIAYSLKVSLGKLNGCICAHLVFSQILYSFARFRICIRCPRQFCPWRCRRTQWHKLR